MSEQTIEQLTQRYQQLNTKKIQAETNLQTAEDNLTTLKSQAKAEYGTDDIAALKAKLAEMEAQNEAARKAYQDKLDAIEADLARVESEQA